MKTLNAILLALAMTVAVAATVGAAGVFNDFNDDGRSDIAVYHPPSGLWYVRSLTGGAIIWGKQWGYNGTLPVPADYDGDGATDLGVYDPASGVWYIWSHQLQRIIAWNRSFGGAGFVPVPGDYDNDGSADLGIYELATGRWSARRVSDDSVIFENFQWGWKGDVRTWEKPQTSTVIPVPYDFDRDGQTDIAVYYRGFSMADSVWYIRGSTGKWWFPTPNWGSSGSIPAPGMYRNVVDYNNYPAGVSIYKVKYSNAGDGTDGTFNTPYMFQFKLGLYPRTLPVPGHDFDGNGWDDHAVYDYLSGNWTISFNDADGNANQQGTTYQQPPRQTFNWGFNGAVPADIYSSIYKACKYSIKPW